MDSQLSILQFNILGNIYFKISCLLLQYYLTFLFLLSFMFSSFVPLFLPFSFLLKSLKIAFISIIRSVNICRLCADSFHPSLPFLCSDILKGVLSGVFIMKYCEPGCKYSLWKLKIQMSTHDHLMEYPVSKACRPPTLKTVAFICNFTCAITAVISPHYHALSCNVYLYSQAYISVIYLMVVRNMTFHLVI